LGTAKTTDFKFCSCFSFIWPTVP